MLKEDLALISVFLAFCHIECRQQDNPRIEPETPVLEVPDIIFNTVIDILKHFDFAPVTMDLCPAGNSGLQEVADHIMLKKLRIVVGMFHHVRTRAYHAHIAQENVDKLGHLVEAGFAQKRPQAGDPGIALGGLLLVGVLVHAHCPEFEAVKGFSTFSAPLLHEEDRAPRVEQDQE